MRQLCCVQEDEWQKPDDAKLPANWPTEGRVEFKDVAMSYRAGLEPAINGLTALIQPHEKGGSSSSAHSLQTLLLAVGVAGRTGSGKSTLMLILFRMYEVQRGKALVSHTVDCNVRLRSN